MPPYPMEEEIVAEHSPECRVCEARFEPDVKAMMDGCGHVCQLRVSEIDRYKPRYRAMVEA